MKLLICILFGTFANAVIEGIYFETIGTAHFQASTFRYDSWTGKPKLGFGFDEFESSNKLPGCVKDGVIYAAGSNFENEQLLYRLQEGNITKTKFEYDVISLMCSGESKEIWGLANTKDDKIMLFSIDNTGKFKRWTDNIPSHWPAISSMFKDAFFMFNETEIINYYPAKDSISVLTGENCDGKPLLLQSTPTKLLSVHETVFEGMVVLQLNEIEISRTSFQCTKQTAYLFDKTSQILNIALDSQSLGIAFISSTGLFWSNKTTHKFDHGNLGVIPVWQVGLLLGQ